jgi:hypothetical protein
MLRTIFVVPLILWRLGMVMSYTVLAGVQILPVVALAGSGNSAFRGDYV